VTIAVNAVSDATSFEVGLSEVTLEVVSISPATVSPVLKQDLTIAFDATFPDINKDDY